MREDRSHQILTSMILVVLFASPTFTWALTTFGKSSPQNQNQNPPPPTPVGKARECRLDSECAGIQNTTCMSDPRDGRTRCLCGDYSAPLNGACTNKFKALGTRCNHDSECIENARCIQRNSTMQGTRCHCEEPYYEESPLLCSGSSSILPYCITSVLFASTLLGSLSSL